MMFTRDKIAKPNGDDHAREAVVTPLADTAASSALTPAPAQPPSTGGVHVVTRHLSMPAAPSALASSREVKPEAKETKKLIVGRGISLNGKISSCDRLIVDGKVEAELEDCHTVEITENGTFKGAAEITGAEVSGHYDGALTVRENLLIRGTGRVSGTVRYGRLHIEDGGEINGDVKSLAAKG